MADRQIHYTDEFQHQVTRLSKRYRHVRDDVEPVIKKLTSGEILGDRLTGVHQPVYKVRVKNQDAKRGKSGGYRLLYYLQTRQRTVLLTLYSKTDRSNIETLEIVRYLKDWESAHPD
jgi:mRNA-degrading endonuclease RelE of RelBE toxin-antitoxin system